MLRQYADKDGSTFDAIVLDLQSLPNRLPCRARRWAYKASTAWRYNPGARGVLAHLLMFWRGVNATVSQDRASAEDGKDAYICERMAPPDP
jgi:hypothetical protein